MILLRALGLLALWGTLAGAAPLPLRPPPPDLAPLVGFVVAPLDKPAIPVPEIPLPPPPLELPVVPVLGIVVPAAPKPMAPLPAPRALPCVGAWLRFPAESLECGRARLGKGEYEDAIKALLQAASSGTDRDILTEARYWLGETLYRVGRWDDAEFRFRQVVREYGPREIGPWALHSAAWAALRTGDPERARETFVQQLAGPQPAPLDAWGRHGLGLALLALGRNEEAERVWAELLGRRPPPELEREAIFWHAEALLRLGQHARAADALARFIQVGQHPFLDAAIVRLGWASLRAGRAPQAVSAFRAYRGSRERELAEAGLALASLAAGDWTAARTTARSLESARSVLALPVLLRLAETVVARRQVAEAQGIVQELLAAQLTQPVRAWVLLLHGETLRMTDSRDEARTQFEMARTVEPAEPIGPQGAVRAARVNFDAREFGLVVQGLRPLLAARLEPGLRLTALLLVGEAAYRSGDYPVAADALQRADAEFPSHPGAPLVRLALAWTALRERQPDAARARFVEFARAHPDSPHAVDALVVAAELALGAGSLEVARDLLDRVVTGHPTHPRADFARLNRAILHLRAGQAAAAASTLRDWVRRAPFPPLLPRALGALGVALLATGAPGEAEREFARAHREGLGAQASLGLGAALLARDRWAEALQPLTDARDTGTAAEARAAEYGLAVAAFHRGALAAFKEPGRATLDAAPQARGAPALLYTLAGIGAETKDWTLGIEMARRLASEFPSDAAADDGLERVGAAAARAEEWQVALEAYTLLRQRFPLSPFVEDSRVIHAEALLRTGRTADGRRELERFVLTAPTDPRAPRAWLLLARAREATGDRTGALDAYARAERDVRTEWRREDRAEMGRLLVLEKRWIEARRVLDPLLRVADPLAASEAAVAIGDTYQGEGEHLAAAEYYMTAGYLAPQSPAGRRGLLGAGRAFVALRQPEAATVVYRKLLAQADLPHEVAAEARRGLAAPGR